MIIISRRLRRLTQNHTRYRLCVPSGTKTFGKADKLRALLAMQPLRKSAEFLREQNTAMQAHLHEPS